MGIIKEGIISGTLPSKEAFVVHFPGYPSSISRAIETLGGIQGISQVKNLLTLVLKVSSFLLKLSSYASY